MWTDEMNNAWFEYILICSFDFVVPEQPMNLRAEALGPNKVQLTWDPPLDAGDSVEKYIIYYNDSHWRRERTFTVDPPRTSYTLEDLTPYTVYHVKVAAVSGRGAGPPTPVTQVRTKQFGKFSSRLLIFLAKVRSPVMIQSLVSDEFQNYFSFLEFLSLLLTKNIYIWHFHVEFMNVLKRKPVSFFVSKFS